MATNPDRASYFPAIEKKHGQPMSYWFDVMSEISDRKYPEQMAYLQENHGFSRTHANALVLYSRGNTSAHRVSTIDEYLADADDTKRATVHRIFGAIQKAHPECDLVIAWNKPMLKTDGQYVFGVTVAKNHILIAPFGEGILDEFMPRLAGYDVNKKTVKVPVDWDVDVELVQDMADARLAQIRS
jgi:uncharacterized protein YdhG (YjbR/CyaY superfamily)